jgi:hypothetical protein
MNSTYHPTIGCIFCVDKCTGCFVTFFRTEIIKYKIKISLLINRPSKEQATNYKYIHWSWLIKLHIKYKIMKHKSEKIIDGDKARHGFRVPNARTLVASMDSVDWRPELLLCSRIPWTERQNSRYVHGFRGPKARTLVVFTDSVDRTPELSLHSWIPWTERQNIVAFTDC